MKLSDEQRKYIEELYRSCYDSLFCYADAILHDGPRAEEAVQDAFRIACAKISDVRRSARPLGWLIRTLQYVIRNMQRTQSRLNNLIVLSAALDDIGLEDRENIDENIIFEDAYMELLGQEDFLLVKMVVLERRTLLEASKALGISPAACRKRFERVKKKMEKKFFAKEE